MKPPQENALRTIQANKYVGNKSDDRAARIAREARPDCVTWNEGWQFPDTLRNIMPGFRHLTAGVFGGFEISRDAGDCITSVHKSHTIEHFSVTQVCDGIDGSKVAKNRTPHMVAFNFLDWPRPVGLINVHLNWVQGIKSGRILDEYEKSCEALSDMIHFARVMGWIPLVQGDINITRREAAKRNHITPYSVFKKHGLKPYSHHLDVIAHDHNWMDPVKTSIIRKHLTGSDHDWIVRDFVRG